MDTVKVQGLFDQISGLQLQVRVIDSEYTEVANELAELAKRKKELAKEEKNWASRTGPLSDQIAEAMAQIQQLVVRNADNEISLPSGKITWKKSKAKVVCVDDDKVIKELREKGLTKFITEGKPALNKLAIQKDPFSIEGISGITIQRETFCVTPTQTEIEEKI